MKCWKLGAVTITALAVFLEYIMRSPQNDSKSSGFVQPKFQQIRETFDEMLSQQKAGLAVAAYVNGELVVDLWGGYADRDAMREWQRDTMTVAFSSSKAVGALLLAILVSRGHLRYEDKVVKYWPEFGAHGKENVTVQWIVEHKAGLTKLDGDITIEQAHDHRYISRLIENTRPKYPPGTAVQYHAITYGWLLDQLFRRADPAKRSIGQFYREEVQPHMTDKDFYVGSPRQQYHRVARMIPSGNIEMIKAMCTNRIYWPLLWQTIISVGKSGLCDSRNPRWLSVVGGTPYNNPAVQEVENLAALGTGTARGLANFVAAIWQEKMIGEGIWKQLSKPTILPGMSDFQLHIGHGLFYDPHPVRKNSYTMNHGGFGVQMLAFDPENKVAFALLRNTLIWDLHEMENVWEVFRRLIKIVENKY